jgi:hypothetical protein
MSEEEAMAALEAAGFNAHLARLPRDDVPEGIVASQGSPDSSNTVSLIVSSGPETIVVPDVVAIDRYRAARLLERLGLRARETPRGITTTNPRTWQKVHDQHPAAGTEVPPGTVIILNVAFAPEGTFVKVEGTGTALVTWGGLGSTHQATVTLPWQRRIPFGDDDIVTVVAQRSGGGGGTIVCQVIREGVVAKRSASSGPYAVCSATD